MSQYRIYKSNSLSGLVARYPGILTQSGLFDNSLLLVVQNRNMGEWLKLELAAHRGVSADFTYVMPEKGLREFCGGYPSARALLGEGDGEKPVLFLDNLKLIMYYTLNELLNRRERIDPVYRDLYRYIQAGDPIDERELTQVRTGRLFELADSIAGLFFHYGMNCRDLISYWERDEFFPAMPAVLKKHEDWQKQLWNHLFHPDQPYLHLSQLLTEIMTNDDSYDGSCKRVVLFGSSFLGDTGLKFFHHLSKSIRVDHFILSPSRVYSSWNGEVQNSLLKSWSTLIGGFATLSEGFEGAEYQDEYLPVPGDSLLNSLQDDILEDRHKTGKIAVREDDESIRIHTFTSSWREVEVLKDLILNALNEDESLKLTDICVLAPDINEYAPFLEALFPAWQGDFPGRDSLPYNIVDLKGSPDSPFIQGFTALFNLPGERFTRRELFQLFDNPCFCETFQINRQERDFWLQLCEDLNIKWGLNETHKRDFYPEASGFNSWEEGFRRLMDGFFLEEEEGDSLPYGLSDETGNQSAGKLIGIVENLFADFHELNNIALPLEQWVLLAEAMMESYITVRDGSFHDQKDRWQLKGIFRDLLNLAEDSRVKENQDLNFTVFRILLNEFIRKSGGERGRYLTQGITCSSLMPLRAIPFRRIYILGLNENAFPGEDLSLGFDLREVVQQTIDLSRRGSDKYAFLETLLSAGDSLTLFYNDRDPVRGETLQPSVLISELLEYLDLHFTFPGGVSPEEWLIRKESIHDYDERYFNGEAGFLSFNAGALKSARIAMGQHSDAETSLCLKGGSGEPRDLLTITDLEQFLQNPASYYFRKSLGIYLEQEENREEDSLENWESGFMDRYRFLSSLLEAPSCLKEPEIMQNWLADRQKRGHLPDSELIFLEKDYFSGRLDDLRNQLEEKGLPDGLPSPRDFLIDPESAPPRKSRGFFVNEEDRSSVLIPGLAFETGERGMIRMAGQLRELSPMPDEAGIWGTIEYCESGSPGIRHFLKSYIKALFMDSLGREGYIDPVGELRLYQFGKRSYPLRHFLFNPSSGTFESGVVPLTGPQERIGTLIRFCLDQLEDPLMLYPEIGESLGASLAARPDLSDNELLSLWKENWERLAVSDSYAGFSPFANCPYRQQFLSSPPETDPGRLRELLEIVYLPFFKKEVKHET